MPPLLNWTVFNAVVQPDNAACRAAEGVGACWGVVAEKGRLILFGRYPYDEQWRPLIASSLLVTLLMLSCLRSFWRPALVLAWVAVYAVFYLLMKGGVAGLTPVDTERWGGLPLTIMLSSLLRGAQDLAHERADPDRACSSPGRCLAHLSELGPYGAFRPPVFAGPERSFDFWRTGCGTGCMACAPCLSFVHLTGRDHEDDDHHVRDACS